MNFFKTKDGIRYGIQIQDKQYLKFIVSDETTRGLYEKNGWFDSEWKSPQKIGKSMKTCQHSLNGIYYLYVGC